jgi:tight adherence protein C
MSAVFPVLIPAFFAAAAVFLAQALAEMRQRQVAKARALGASLGKGGSPWQSFKAFVGESRLSWSAELERALPGALRSGLESRIARADAATSPGLLAFDMLACGGAGLALGLLLGLGAIALAGAGLGLALPFLRINDLAQRRQMALRKDLPDALDLLTACVEAGLGFDQALARVAGRLKGGPLKKELENCVANIGMGASRRESLRELERRAGLEELSQVVGALLQADKRGVPLGPALRAQSGQLRALRSLRVKKLAAEAPLKMLFPLMAFILPVVFIVLFGPIVLKWQAGGF